MVCTIGAVIALAACHRQQPNLHREAVVLSGCWDERSVAEAERAQGQGKLLYNPDGPMLLVDECERHSLVVSFAKREDGLALGDQLARRSSGRLFGGAMFEAAFSGKIISNAQSGGPPPGKGILIEQISVGKEVKPKTLPLRP